MKNYYITFEALDKEGKVLEHGLARMIGYKNSSEAHSTLKVNLKRDLKGYHQLVTLSIRRMTWLETLLYKIFK